MTGRAASVAAPRRLLLAILAHPDDETLAIGGTLARYAAEGATVHLVVATSGESGLRGASPETARRTRERELRRAAAVLGIREPRLLGLRDGGLAALDAEGPVQTLMGVIASLRPQVVVTFGPDGISGHPDHVTVGRWTTEAFDRWQVGEAPTARLFYIAPSPATQQACGGPQPDVRALGSLVRIDIGPYRQAKVRAAQAHGSQHHPFRGPPLEESSRLVCHEDFYLVRPACACGPSDDLFAAPQGDAPPRG